MVKEWSSEWIPQWRMESYVASKDTATQDCMRCRSTHSLEDHGFGNAYPTLVWQPTKVKTRIRHIISEFGYGTIIHIIQMSCTNLTTIFPNSTRKVASGRLGPVLGAAWLGGVLEVSWGRLGMARRELGGVYM